MSLLFLLVFTVIFLNLGSIRENLESPSCPTGYRYAGGSNSCIPPSGGEFVCPSGATKVRGGDGSVSCLDNSRLQEALNHRGRGGPVTLVDPPPASAASPSNPSCPTGYNYTADGNRCISTTGGPFICPSVATKMRAGNGEIQCIDNNRVQTALNHRGPGGPMTLVDSPPSAASPQQRPAEPQGVPSCGMEKFAAY
jgi:hypothetical protein